MKLFNNSDVPTFAFIFMSFKYIKLISLLPTRGQKSVKIIIRSYYLHINNELKIIQFYYKNTGMGTFRQAAFGHCLFTCTFPKIVSVLNI